MITLHSDDELLLLPSVFVKTLRLLYPIMSVFKDGLLENTVTRDDFVSFSRITAG